MTNNRQDQDSVKTGGPRSAVRVMDILYQLARTPAAVSLAHLSEALKLPKTSVFSLLRALDKGGYIVQVSGGYQLGPEAFRLGAAISQHRIFPNFVRPVLENVARRTGETVILGALTDDGMEAKYLDVIESPSPLRFAVRVGDTRPLYSSTTGKIFLAHFARERLNAYLATVKREQFTPRTLTRKSDILAELDAIRGRVAVSNIDGMVEGITSFGAPIYEHDGHLAAALVVSGPDSRMAPRAEDIKSIVIAAGHDISRLLNCSGPYPPRKPVELT